MDAQAINGSLRQKMDAEATHCGSQNQTQTVMRDYPAEREKQKKQGEGNWKENVESYMATQEEIMSQMKNLVEDVLKKPNKRFTDSSMQTWKSGS